MRVGIASIISEISLLKVVKKSLYLSYLSSSITELVFGRLLSKMCSEALISIDDRAQIFLPKAEKRSDNLNYQRSDHLT